MQQTAIYICYFLSNFNDSGLRLLNNFIVTLTNFSIMNCTHQDTNSFPENSALSIVYRGSGRNMSYVQIYNSQFQYNSVGNKETERNHNVAATGSSYPGRGGALGIFINEPIRNTAINIVISECSFINNTAGLFGGAIYLTSNQLSSGHSFRLINSVFEQNYAGVDGGGFSQGSTKTGNFSIHTFFTASNYHLENCNFTQNTAQFGGAVGFVTALDRKRTADTISISDCIFDGNVGTYIGAALMFSSLTYPHLPEQDFPHNISNWYVFNSRVAPIPNFTNINLSTKYYLMVST